MRKIPAILASFLTLLTTACSTMPELGAPGISLNAAAASADDGQEKIRAGRHFLSIASDLDARGDTEAALSFYERATMSEDAVAFVKLGDAYMRAGRVDDAINAYRSCLLHSPEDSAALLGLGGALIKSGKLDEGHNIMVKAVAITKTPAAYNRLGLVQVMLGRPKEASDSFEEALALNKHDTDIKTNLALATALNNKPDRAIKLISELAEAQPTRLQHRRNLVLVLGITGRASEEVLVSAAKGLGEAEIKALLIRADKIRGLSTPKARAIAFSASSGKQAANP